MTAGQYAVIAFAFGLSGLFAVFAKWARDRDSADVSGFDAAGFVLAGLITLVSLIVIVAVAAGVQITLP